MLHDNRGWRGWDTYGNEDGQWWVTGKRGQILKMGAFNYVPIVQNLCSELQAFWPAPHPLPSRSQGAGVGGLSTLGGGGVDTTLWLNPPPTHKRAQLTAPDHRASEVTRTQKSAKNEWDFWN